MVYVLYEIQKDFSKKVVGLSSELEKVQKWHSQDFSRRSFTETQFLILKDICE